MPTLYTRLTLIIGGIVLLAACSEERPPRSSIDFVDNPMMLEAAMVRCSKDRTATRYDAECVNARQAVKLIEAKEEAGRRADLDAQSERKRQALRRTQEAASQARRRAAEAERLRKEAEYLAQFGEALPPEELLSVEEQGVGNLPSAVIPDGVSDQTLSSGPGDALPATDGGNAAGSAALPEEDPKSDLESIRDELQRRNEEGGGD